MSKSLSLRYRKLSRRCGCCSTKLGFCDALSPVALLSAFELPFPTSKLLTEKKTILKHIFLCFSSYFMQILRDNFYKFLNILLSFISRMILACKFHLMYSIRLELIYEKFAMTRDYKFEASADE